MACVGTCAISGLAFGAGGTLVNRAGSNDVIVQTGNGGRVVAENTGARREGAEQFAARERAEGKYVAKIGDYLS